MAEKSDETLAGAPRESPNNCMQRSGDDKVLGRGRGRAVLGRVTSARVLKRPRAVADARRWATLRAYF